MICLPHSIPSRALEVETYFQNWVTLPFNFHALWSLLDEHFQSVHWVATSTQNRTGAFRSVKDRETAEQAIKFLWVAIFSTNFTGLGKIRFRVSKILEPDPCYFHSNRIRNTEILCDIVRPHVPVFNSHCSSSL